MHDDPYSTVGMSDEDIIEQNLSFVKCPSCDASEMEFVYCGSFPHVYQITCSRCGFGSPVGHGKTKFDAMRDAFDLLIYFLLKIGKEE